MKSHHSLKIKLCKFGGYKFGGYLKRKKFFDNLYINAIDRISIALTNHIDLLLIIIKYLLILINLKITA